jgi:hypothetical protein
VDRTALLLRWSELAPEECEYVPISPLGRNGRAVLLSALIEAIRKRGWHYTLESDEEPENEQPAAWHAARILQAPFSLMGRPSVTEAAEPCDALLQAYCLCLQAGKERDE